MRTQRISLAVILCLSAAVTAPAQVPPPPPAPSDPELVKNVKQLFSDLTAHRSKLEQAAVDQETLRLQTDILKTWDKLLDSTGKPSPQQQSSSNQNQQPDQPPQPQNGPQNQQPSGDSPRREGQPQNQPGPQQDEQEPEGTTDSPGQSTGKSTDAPADKADAETRRREANRLARLKQAERERLMKEVWGKLPRRIRQKLLNAADEQYLPEYEDRIKEYFRKLSEPANGSRGD